MADPRLLLAVLPVAAAALERQRALQRSGETGVPRALLDYFDAPGVRDRPDHDRLIDIALDYPDTSAALVAVASWVLRSAWLALGWHRIRALGRNTLSWDSKGLEQDFAAQALLWSNAELLRYLWHADEGGREWLTLWKETGSRDAEVLEHAGLGEAELKLLAAAAATVT